MTASELTTQCSPAAETEYTRRSPMSIVTSEPPPARAPHEQTHVGMRGAAERDDFRRMAQRMIAQPFEMRHVGGNDRGAAWQQPFEDFRLGVGNRLFAAQHLDMRGAIVVMTATCGRTCRVSAAISPAWFMPISKMPKRLRAGSMQRQAERHADVVVVAFDRAMLPRLDPVERGEDRFLDPEIPLQSTA